LDFNYPFSVAVMDENSSCAARVQRALWSSSDNAALLHFWNAGCSIEGNDSSRFYNPVMNGSTSAI
jgi:hypothetical protein